MEAIEIINESASGALLSAKEFLDLIRRSNDRWWDNDGRTSWVFRGVGDSDKYRLIPSAWREPSYNKLYPLLDKIAFEKRGEDFKEYEIYIEAQNEALSSFWSSARESGLDVPWHHDTFPTKSLAQHHGIPTSLLDWTNSPIYAAFFAVQSALSKSSPPENLCVWAFNSNIQLCGTFIGREDYKKDASKMTLELWKQRPIFGDWAQFNFLEDDLSKNQYLKAQKGIFVEIDNAELFYSIHNRWPSMEDYLDPQFVEFPEGISDEEYPKPVLIKHVLGRSEFEELSTILEREGISRAALMPTLDNVASDVIAKWNRALV